MNLSCRDKTMSWGPKKIGMQLGFEPNSQQWWRIQATTVIVDTVIVESTALVEQKTLTTQFYLLLVESPL